MADMNVSSSARDNARQLEELKQEHEQKLAKLRADQQKSEAEVRASGDAAVNHIRKSTDDKIESARAQAEDKLQREDAVLSKNYSTLKKRAGQQNETMAQEIAQAEARTDDKIQETRRRETQTLNQSQDKLKEFLANQKDLRNRVQNSANEDIRTVQTKTNETRRKTIDEANQEMRALETKNKTRSEEMKTQSRETFAEAKAQAERRLGELRRENETRLNQEREQASGQYTQIRKKTHEQIVAEETKGKQALELQANENKRKLEGTRDLALKTNEKTQAVYSNEAQRIEAEGSQDIHYRQSKFDTLKKEQVSENQKSLKQLEADQLAREAKLRRDHEDKVQFTVKTLDNELVSQREEFKDKFAKDANTFRSTLNNQKEVFLKEQYKQNAQQNSVTTLAADRADDPFYRPQAFDATLTENATSYELRAKVPAHERDNVQIRVKEGKITLSSARNYEQKFEDKGVLASTNSQQTYRQEFKLDKPADAKRVITSIGNDGSISALIPKKGFSGPTRRSKV